MGTWKTRGVVLAALAALLVASTGVHALVLKGRGELTAAGSGFAVIDFRGGLAVRGVGVLIVEEDADVEVEGHGRVTPLDDGRLLYEGFGRARVRSRDARTRVEVAGGRLRLHVRGVGVARLVGHGSVWTDDADAGWADETVIEFDAESGS